MPKRYRTYRPQYPWAEYQRKWRAKRGASYNPSYRGSLRELVNAEKLRRGACADCGLVVTAATFAVFEFDHRDPSLKRFLIARARHNEYGPGVLAEEMEKCDLRCSNCHRIRTVTEKHWLTKRAPTDPGDQGVLF